MIIAVVFALIAGVATGWIAHTFYVRQMWSLERRFRRAAMGGRPRERR